MNRKQVILINGFSGILNQIITLLVQFLTRVILLRYIGVEILGISSTLSSVISTLALTELGFQNAVVFYLYAPLREEDNHKINQIMMILKRVYEIIGLIFIVLTILSMPLLKYILKGVDITWEVVCIYALIGFNNASTYFIAYKRALLFADQKEYISKIVDSICNIVIFLIKCYCIIVCKNYLYYLILQILQTVLSNIWINGICKRKYPFIYSCPFDKQLFRKIFKDVQNVFVGKLAGYVYGATDNLVISSCLGAIFVGYLTNYSMLVSTIKQGVNVVFNAMTPIIGNMLLDGSSNKSKEEDFRFYSYIRFFIATVIIVPWLVMANDLVGSIFGVQYILSQNIVILLAIDMYIHIIYTPCVQYIEADGLFQEDKSIALCGTVINIVISVVCVFFIGVEGVLIGTAISQIYFWIARAHLLYFKVFSLDGKKYIKYFGENIVWLFVVVVFAVAAKLAVNSISMSNKYIALMSDFVICEIIVILGQLFAFIKTTKGQKLISLIKHK
ncbi:MAG: oligosaccharide flippase family protein [Candidatus Choladocola sp.]|nr:oligosaccharide flippase family protein [Candidatus Choladocola sp.]